jgi:hypothetical protein
MKANLGHTPFCYILLLLLLLIIIIIIIIIIICHQLYLPEGFCQTTR